MVNGVQGERRWQSDIRSLKAGIAHICKSKQFADVTITVGAGKFKAHRLILLARSPAFSRLLTRQGEAPLPAMFEIKLNNVSKEAFEILLNYIYTDHIPQLESPELILEVHRAANDYGQQGLREACEKLIVEWEITFDTVISVLQMSDVEFVKDRCWEYLKKYAKAVLSSNGILDADSETLSEIFEKGYLDGVPAIDRVTNVVRWAAKLYPSEKGYQRVREHLLIPNGEKQRSLMSWLGFEKLTLEQLGKVLNDYPKLISDAEVSVFFQYQTAAADRKPALPSWVES